MATRSRSTARSRKRKAATLDYPNPYSSDEEAEFEFEITEEFGGKVANVATTQPQCDEPEAPEDDGSVETATPETTAFCCAHCRCPPEVLKKKGASRVVSAGDGAPWHRCCCHGLIGKKIKLGWVSPIDQIMQSEMVEEEEEERKRELSGAELRRKIRGALQHKTNRSFPDPLPMLAESTIHRSFAKRFRRKKKEIQRRSGTAKPAVVLDLFSGIGGGIVALKRLGVAMKKVRRTMMVCFVVIVHSPLFEVIHVEQDKVATHVFRWNHDCEYNRDLNHDGINYVYYNGFRSLYNNKESDIRQFLSQHGPVDIVIVNGFQEDRPRKQNGHLLAMSHFIRELLSAQPDNHIYFLAENAAISEHDDLNSIGAAFQMPGVFVDARWLSPCQRDRQFFFNFPMHKIDFDSPAAKSSAVSCLEEGWTLPGTHFGKEDDDTVEKASTFMGSSAGIDDERMVKIKVVGEDAFKEGRYSVLERERIMGFPEGYVSGAVAEIFKQVTNAFAATGQFISWSTIINKRYHHFACEPNTYKFIKDSECPFFAVKICPPTSTALPRYYFPEEGYAKHLLGNTFCVPVVEHLLRPLLDMFETREYKEHNFYWEEEGCEEGDHNNDPHWKEDANDEDHNSSPLKDNSNDKDHTNHYKQEEDNREEYNDHDEEGEDNREECTNHSHKQGGDSWGEPKEADIGTETRIKIEDMEEAFQGEEGDEGRKPEQVANQQIKQDDEDYIF